jgi:arylsulfatase A-like enzyme
METLQSVDDLVKTVVSKADQGPRETIVLYLSDNGYSLGSHRHLGKVCGYEECGRLPGLIRAPGDPSGSIASIADMAPTLADLARVKHARTDGYSLVPQFEGAPFDPDRALLLRNATPTPPPFWGLRTDRWKYLRHSFAAGFEGELQRPEELYDLQADPFELENVAAEPAYRKVRAELRARLKAERAAAPHR